MKKLNFINLLFMIMVCNVFAQQTEEKDVPIPTASVGYKQVVGMMTGPIGESVAIPPYSAPQTLSCTVDGITITASGSVNWSYNNFVNPVAICLPTAPYTGVGNWTGSSSNGFLTYTFSQPILSARVSYSSVNWNDIATITTNSTSAVQLLDPCSVTVAGNLLTGSFAPPPGAYYGNVGITVVSATPFTTITLTNTGGQTGWVIGNPCNFIVTLPPSPTIANCPKIAMGEMCYKNTSGLHETPFSVFNTTTNGSMNSGCAAATINGVPCNSTNVTIETLTPLPFGCTFNPNGNGKILIPLGTNPFSASIYYRFRSIANPAIFSETYRADFGINNRITTTNYNISLTAANPVYSGGTNILSNCSRQVNSDGSCTSIGALLTNVTFSDTTSPPNPYWTINTAGNVVLRPGVVITNTVPPLPQTTHELTYTMCIPSSTVWCNSGKVVITYGYPMNKPASNSNNLEKVLISPNPSSDGIFNILFDTTIEKVTLEVYNNMGQKMYEEQADGKSEHLLAIDRLPKGTYILKLKDNNQTITKNIVKQ